MIYGASAGMSFPVYLYAYVYNAGKNLTFHVVAYGDVKAVSPHVELLPDGHGVLIECYSVSEHCALTVCYVAVHHVYGLLLGRE